MNGATGAPLAKGGENDDNHGTSLEISVALLFEEFELTSGLYYYCSWIPVCPSAAALSRIGTHWRRKGEKSNAVSEGDPLIVVCCWLHLNTFHSYHFYLPDPACITSHYYNNVNTVLPLRVFVAAVRHVLGIGLWKGSGKGLLMYTPYGVIQ